MSSPASIGKHPIHPMLVAFPIGLLVFSLVCDLIFVFGSHEPVWSEVALYTMGGGIIGAVLAALPGFIDFLSIHEREMKSIAWKHMLINVGALLVFIGDFWARVGGTVSRTTTVTLSVIGVILFGIGGWLGGKMVYEKGMAVEAVEQLSKQLERAKRA
ncbi:MAG TPA: DUF2231 domain-containing protein [Candidatus Acidoferrales bacterium]|nr:DUF2231 domain-containing protein [Candidatus Acidoferrales bacterium]